MHGYTKWEKMRRCYCTMSLERSSAVQLSHWLISFSTGMVGEVGYVIAGRTVSEGVQ